MGAIEPAFSSMAKLSWNSVESVGDQSAYVSQIANGIYQLVTVLRQELSGTKFFKVYKKWCYGIT